MLVQQYIEHISKVKRYSQRTCAIYQDCLDGFYAYMKQSCPDASETECLDVQMVRRYEVHLMDERRLQARTVNLHLSVLSGFCRYLIKNGILQSNPVRLVTRPKEQKRLPVFIARTVWTPIWRKLLHLHRRKTWNCWSERMTNCLTSSSSADKDA